MDGIAGMAELADALDLGSSGRPCRFESCCPHSERDFRALCSYGVILACSYGRVFRCVSAVISESDLLLTSQRGSGSDACGPVLLMAGEPAFV